MKTWQELPKEIKKKMLKRQFQQRSEKDKKAFKCSIFFGFDWYQTKEGDYFWHKVLSGNFDLFFEKYPKKTESSTQRLGKLFEQFGKDLQNFKP
jgi:hypothetical protein